MTSDTTYALEHDDQQCSVLTGKVNDSPCASCRRERKRRENSTLPIEQITSWKVETTSTGVILTINGSRYATASGESISRPTRG